MATLIPLAVGPSSFLQSIARLVRSPPPAVMRAGRVATSLAVPRWSCWWSRRCCAPLDAGAAQLGPDEHAARGRRADDPALPPVPVLGPVHVRGAPGVGLARERRPSSCRPGCRCTCSRPCRSRSASRSSSRPSSGALGAWRLASRFTESRAVRALFTVVTVVNSRWAMQIAAGHTWHLLYGLLPWMLYYFDRAIDPTTPSRDAVRDVVIARPLPRADGLRRRHLPGAAHGLRARGVRRRCSRRTARMASALRARGLRCRRRSGSRRPSSCRCSSSCSASRASSSPTRRSGRSTSPPSSRGASATTPRAATSSAAPCGTSGACTSDGPRSSASSRASSRAAGPRERALKWAGFVMFSFVALGGVAPADAVATAAPAAPLQVAARAGPLAVCRPSSSLGLLRGLGRRAMARAARARGAPGVEALLGLSPRVALAIDMGTRVARRRSRSRS